MTRDFLGAARKTFGDAWENPRYRVTTDVTLMAMMRVLSDYLRSSRGPRTFDAIERQKAFENLLEPSQRMAPEFREEGFYERFAARGQIERVGVIQRSLANAIGVARPAAS